MPNVPEEVEREFDTWLDDYAKEWEKELVAQMAVENDESDDAGT